MASKLCLEFKTISQSMQCGWTDHAAIIVRNDKQLKWMWDRCYAHSLEPKPLPELDFGKVMWVCVFRGQYPTWGYTTEVRRITEKQDAHNTFLLVEILESNPSRWMYLKHKQEFSQPFHIVEMKRRDLSFRFKYRQRTRW